MPTGGVRMKFYERSENSHLIKNLAWHIFYDLCSHAKNRTVRHFGRQSVIAQEVPRMTRYREKSI